MSETDIRSGERDNPDSRKWLSYEETIEHLKSFAPRDVFYEELTKEAIAELIYEHWSDLDKSEFLNPSAVDDYASQVSSEFEDNLIQSFEWLWDTVEPPLAIGQSW